MSSAATTDLETLASAAADVRNASNNRRLSVADRAYILKARARPNPPTVAEIASVIGCAESSVYRVLAAAQLDVIPVLATFADEAVEHLRTAAEVAARKGYQQPALALLHYGQKLEPLVTDRNASSTAVTVNVAVSPGTPTASAAAISTPTVVHADRAQSASLLPLESPSPLIPLRPTLEMSESEDA